MADSENLGSLTDCYIIQPNGKKALAINSGGVPLDNQIVDANGNPVEIDEITRAMITIAYAHHEVHEGDSFDVGWYDVDLDSGNILSIAFKTPDTGKWFHLIASANNSSGSLFEILEGPTITIDTGTDLQVFNKNRNSLNESGALTIEAVPVTGFVTLNPTITADGLIINAESIGSGKEKVGGSSRGVAEHILKPDTIYAFRLTGLEDNGAANVHLDWYEHTSKEST